MRGMRGKNHKEDVVINTMHNEFCRNMTVMALADKKTIFPSRFFACFWIKASLQPLQPMGIACPSF